MSIVIKNWGPNDNYGPDELNRVEANTQYIADYLADAGYIVDLLPIKTDRTEQGYEFADSLTRVETNIDRLAAAFVFPPGYEAPRSWAALLRHDYRDANRLEHNLELIYNWAVLAVAAFRYCGTLYAGEDGDIY